MSWRRTGAAGLVFVGLGLLPRTTSGEPSDSLSITAGIEIVFGVGSYVPLLAIAEGWTTLIEEPAATKEPRPVAVIRAAGRGKLFATGIDLLVYPPQGDNEQFVRNLALAIAAPGRTKLLFTTTHLETIDSYNVAALENDLNPLGFEVLPLRDRISPEDLADTAILWVAGATGDFAPEEVQAIRAYVESGGGLALSGQCCGRGTMTEYGMNRLAEAFGVRWLASQKSGFAGFKVFYPRTRSLSPALALHALQEAHSLNGDALTSRLAHDPGLKKDLLTAATYLSDVCDLAAPRDEQRRLVDHHLQDFIGNRFPYFYRRGRAFALPAEFPSAMLRESLWYNWRTCVPLAVSQQEAMIQFGGLNSQRTDLLTQHGLILADNDRADTRQIRALLELLRHIPKEMHQLKGIAMRTGLETGDMSLGFARMPYVSARLVGSGKSNPFPLDVPPSFCDLFTYDAIATLNSAVDLRWVDAQPLLASRKRALLKAALFEPNNYLQSRVYSGFYLGDSTAFFPAIAQLYFANTRRALELGLERLRYQLPCPIEQFLFVADVYSRGGSETIAMHVGESGQITSQAIRLVRDPEGRIGTLKFPDRDYIVQYNSAGRVTSVSEATSQRGN